MTEANNPLDELSELFVCTAKDVEGGRGDEMYCQLRFGETELVLEDGTVFKVSINRAFLGLDLEGLTISPGSEFGAVVKENAVSVEHETKESKTTNLVGAVTSKLSNSPTANASAKAEHSRSRQTNKKSTYKTTQTRVTPRGGQKWEILAIDEQALDGDYLSVKNALCRFKGKKGSNRQTATAQIFVKQRDMLFRQDSTGVVQWLKLSRNKEKLLNILIAKALNSQAAKGDHLYTGALILSEAVTDHEA